MRKLDIKFTSMLVLLTYLLSLVTSQAKAEGLDVISAFSVQETIGLKEVPVINITLNISKTVNSMLLFKK